DAGLRLLARLGTRFVTSWTEIASPEATALPLEGAEPPPFVARLAGPTPPAPFAFVADEVRAASDPREALLALARAPDARKQVFLSEAPPAGMGTEDEATPAGVVRALRR